MQQVCEAMACEAKDVSHWGDQCSSGVYKINEGDSSHMGHVKKEGRAHVINVRNNNKTVSKIKNNDSQSSEVCGKDSID